MKLYICQTLDGYIAKEDGSIDFLNQISERIEASPNVNIKNSYTNFMKDIENVVEGYKTYSQISKMGYGEQFKDFNHYVLTNNHKLTKDTNVKEFIDFNKLEKLNLDSKKTFFIGGSTVIKEAFNRMLIKEVIITQLPIMLGDGIKLFDHIECDLEFEVKNIYYDKSFVELQYKVNYSK